MAVENQKLQFLIEQFEALDRQLTDAIARNDETQLQQLSSNIELCYGQLIAIVPNTAEEREMKCTFLLEQLLPMKLRSTLELEICEQILAICKAQ